MEDLLISISPLDKFSKNLWNISLIKLQETTNSKEVKIIKFIINFLNFFLNRLILYLILF